MQKFIVKTASFTLLVFLIIFLSILVTNRVIDKTARFRTSENVTTIVLGHSHSECAFNDSLITNAANYSESGESYFYTYIKLSKLLSQNRTIEVVLLEFTNNQISEQMDEWTWGEKFLAYRYRRYAPFMSFNEKELLLKENLRGVIGNLSLSLETNLNTIKDKRFNYIEKIGGYLYLERNETEKILSGLRKKNKELITGLKADESLSETNLHYLKKIIEECDKYNIELYLVRSPMHKEYTGYSNENVFKRLLGTQFNKVELLDFKDFPLSEEEFGDLEHLNHKGAKKFSLFFNDLLRKGLLVKPNKQEYIFSEMGKLQ